MLPFQFGRGLLWTLFAYPVVRMSNTSRIETAGIIAALFGVGSFALLIPNPLMPASVAHSHLWKRLLSDLSLGRNRRMGAGCRREARRTGPKADHVSRQQLGSRARVGFER
jgi:hypothetical protein